MTTWYIIAGFGGLAGLMAWGALRRLKVLRERDEAILDQRVAERSAEIRRQRDQLQRANAELRFAKQAAEQASQARTELLDSLSQQMRAPIHRIVNTASQLLETRLDGEQQEHVSTVRRAGNAALGLVSDVLDFSQLEAGRLELEQRPFELRTCVEEALDLVASSALEKQLELVYWITEGVPRRLVGDPVRLRQVLLNLLSNAVKFTDKGEVVVTVEAQIVDAKPSVFDPHRIRVTVEDTGVGIPRGRMRGLFDSYTQVEASAPTIRGPGLGLAIARGLVDKMGGRIWVESEVGRGSTFHFTFVAEVAAEAQASGSGANLIGKRALIVDDNARSRRVLEQQIDAWGLVAQSVGTGAEALSRVRSGESFDLAILAQAVSPDTFEESGEAVPERRLLDAEELAKDVRQYRDRSTLPLMLFTSRDRRDRDAEGEFGAVLSRPVKLSQLYRALLELLGVPRGEKTPAVRRRASERLLAEIKPLAILLAEGTPVNQMVAHRMLEQLGYRADLAVDGQEVLAAVERQPYDVVLMDVGLPELDGLEATRRIRRERSGPRPWIVAMATPAEGRDAAACEAAGMDDHLTKPLLLDNLREALRRSRSSTAELPA